MRAMVWLLVVLLCHGATCFIVRPGSNAQYFDANNTVAISMPHELFVDSANKILLRSMKPLVKVSVDMLIYGVNMLNFGSTVFDRSNLSESKDGFKYIYEANYFVPLELKPNDYFNINITYFYYPSETHRSEDHLMARSFERYVRLVSRFAVIMGETEKALYRPGDRVRFRFIALTSRNIVPLSGPASWPKYRVIGDFDNRQIEKIKASERERRLKAPYFDLIEVQDPLNNVIQQWKDVKLLDSLNLTHKLLSDATEGEWKVEARIEQEIEVVKFQVKNYVLPRFQARVELPKAIQPTDTELKFSVCATYTNGPIMPGTYDAQVCVCNQNLLESQEKLKELLPKNECPDSQLGVRRTCTRFSGIMDRAACTNIIANVSQLLKGETPDWMDKVGVFVEVAEENTGSSIVVSGIAELQRWPEPKLELTMRGDFKHGFPIVGQVMYRNSENVSEEKLKIIVREVNDSCGFWWRPSTNYPIKLLRLITVKPGVETYNFVLPPLDFTNTALVSVQQARQTSEDVENSPTELVGKRIGLWWMPRLPFQWDLEASKRLQLWDGNTGLAIQVTVLNVSCPGNAHLRVQSNQVLPANTALMLEFVSRGRLMRRKIELGANYKCAFRNDDFGHYDCDAKGGIRCLTGWTGSNCLTPICKAYNCGIGGACVAPETCACKPGWKGDSCEICVPSKGCLHGTCLEGDDCVCETGFTGYLCDQALVELEDLNTEERVDKVMEQIAVPLSLENKGNKVRRTTFEHTAVVELNGDFGPKFRAVAYVVVGGEMASDFVQIDNLEGCSTPALSQTSKIGGGLSLSKQLAAPGEKVDLSLKVSTGITSNEAIANTCLLRLVDVATNNFDNVDMRRIDFDGYMKMLNDYKPAYDVYDLGSTESAYQAAGIDFAMFTPTQESIVPIMSCPMFFAKGATPDGRFESVENLDTAVGNEKPRLRDFFPEVWLFETAKLTQSKFNKSLTVPDTLTAWDVNAVCFTTEGGLWMPIEQPQLTVRMPFFVEFTPPVAARRGEVLHLPISVFVYPETTLDGIVSDNCNESICYEMNVTVDVDPLYWNVVGGSAFRGCICAGCDKRTFRLPLSPRRIGNLNVTVTAIGRQSSNACGKAAGVSGNVKSSEVATVSDAIRRSVRVIAEGVEKRVTIGSAFCSSKTPSTWNQTLHVQLPDKVIVADSLRSYVAVSGNVVGRALANLDDLVQIPTGCGEQNLAKVAPSVAVLQYLLAGRQDNLSAIGDRYEDRLLRKAANYILDGFDNQLKYRHPQSGAFSTFGPQNGANGSTWLTAYVFEVFSKAEALPIALLAKAPLDAYTILASAFDFLVSQQQVSGDGCFEEAGRSFLPWMQNSEAMENRLQLTAHVLNALGFASNALKESKGEFFTSSARAAIRCIESAAMSMPFKQWSTQLIAKVVYATKKFPTEVTSSMRRDMINVLLERSSNSTSLSGSLKWWQEDARNEVPTAFFRQVNQLLTTAYALLALGPENLRQEDRLATIRWISQQQNENGGFYSTQDTVVVLNALTQSASSFPSPVEATSVTIRSTPKSLVNIKVNINKENQLVSNMYEIGAHNQSDISNLRLDIKAKRPVCILVHYTAIYNVPQPQKSKEAFFLDVIVDQGSSRSTVACTTAFTTVCLGARRPQSTGMILVTLQLPSGWVVMNSELDKMPLHESFQKLEFTDKTSELSAYFNGFSVNETDVRKCFTIPLRQQTYVQMPQPSYVTEYEYYENRILAQTPLKLDTCELYWEPQSGGVVEGLKIASASPVEVEAEKKALCPKCETINVNDVVDRLNRSLCDYQLSLYVFKVDDSTNSTAIRGIMYSFEYVNRLASWKTTVRILKACECKVAVKETVFGIFGRYIQPGALNVDLADYDVVPSNELVDATDEFLKVLNSKMEGMKENERKDYCVHYSTFSALLKRFKKKI